ncbi:lipopolysaccharide biosynthesis protein [Metabacillus sp. 113a]|uniref:lipopolysaccharide biosynthesis protein n=1 Tax=Metabacillus sp. 113a TaxID=3404706 RepID=UPI003CE818B0
MLKNTIIYTIGTMLPKLIVFIMLPIYMKYLSPEEYGLVQTINALVSVLSIFYLTSLRTSVTRSYIDYENDDEKQGFILSVFLFLIAFSTLLSWVLLNLEVFITPYLFNNIPSDPYFGYMILLSFLSVFPTIPLTLLRIKEQPVKYVTFNAVETILIVILTIYLLIEKNMGAVGSLQAIIYARFLMGIFYIIYLFKFTRLKFRECKLVYITSSLALAIPLIPHFLAGWINSVGDRVLIERYLNLFELGIYSIGSQFNIGLMMLVTSFNMAYSPKFFKLLKKNQLKQNYYSKIFETVVLALLILSLFGLILIPFFINNFGGESYKSSYLFVWFLFGGTIWHLGYILSVSSLIYYKKMKNVAIITVITAISNIILNLLFIPLIGITGAAIAAYIAYFFEFYFVKRYANHYTKEHFKVEGKMLYIAQILLLANLAFVWLLNNYLTVIITIIIIAFVLFKKYGKQVLFKETNSYKL